jgi:NAD(P)-dependent dehydrogenase (short-subunit alcohol dehydrogenase family)
MPDRRRVAVVTGANQGIGWAIVKGLRQRLESAGIVCSHQAAPFAQRCGYTLQEGAMDGFLLAYEGFDPEAEGLREALTSTGNGYLCART